MEPPEEWDKQIYDFSDCEYLTKQKGFGSGGKPWYEDEPHEG